jgi:hypothetical protein
MHFSGSYFLFGIVGLMKIYNDGHPGTRHPQTRHMMFIIFAIALIASIFASGKAEAQRCPSRDCGTCCIHCSEDTLITAARLLNANLCNIANTKALNQLQGLVTRKSKIQFIMEGPNGCNDSGVQDYLAGFIPYMPILTCTMPPTIVSATMDGKNRVIVVAIDNITIDSAPLTVHCEQIYEVVGDGCELRLISNKIVQTSCLLA